MSIIFKKDVYVFHIVACLYISSGILVFLGEPVLSVIAQYWKYTLPNQHVYGLLIHNWYQTFSEVSTTSQLKTLKGSTMSPFPTPSTPTRCRLCCISHSAQTSLNSLQIQLPQVLLLVNLASFWAYTPQYYALNALTEQVPALCFTSWNWSENCCFFQYTGRPFKILGFPCNQFLRQVL